MAVEVGQTLFLAPKSDAVPTHLWVVAGGPIHDPPQVVLVSLSSAREGSDRTTVLRPGEHPFVRHETVVFYQDARVVMVHQLEKLLEAGVAKEREPCSPEPLERIQQGCLKSPRIEPWIRETCRAALHAQGGRSVGGGGLPPS